MIQGALDRLNPSQRQAVVSVSPRVLVMAGAGSGKTAVLTARIAHLQANERIGTSNMLALTFTRLAAAEMKERVERLLGKLHAKNLTAGTFHSFCVQVLRKYGHHVGIEANFSIYDEEDRMALIEGVIEDLKLTGKVKKTFDPWGQHVDQYHIMAAKEYQYRLKRNNALDLDGLLSSTLLLFHAYDGVALEIKQQYTHIFIDEYQDTDDRQAQIIELINPNNLFIVGDPAQAIYGWRGAKIENILEFEDMNPGTEAVRMERNYRSTKPILALANQIIAESTHKSPLQLWSDKDGRKVLLNAYQCEDDESEAIAEHIKTQHQHGIQDLSDVAILCRTNYQVELYSKALQKAGLATYVLSNVTDPLKSFDVRRILDYMAYICNRRDGRALRHIINWPERRMTDLELHQAEMDATIAMQTLAEYLGDKLQILSSWETIKDWESCVSLLWDMVVDNIGIVALYEKQGRQSRINDLCRAKEATYQWKSKQISLGEPIDPYTFLRWLRTRDIQDRLAQEKPEGVQVLTVHAAKGLEWEHVYVPGCNLDVFPSKRGDIEEERRLFYVAITRARETLCLSYYGERKSSWGKRKMLKMQPSPFLSV